MTTQAKPVLGYILKGYPRISETFISNEIFRLEQQGFNIIIFPMRHPRENFSHESVKQIQAQVYYLPTHLFRNFFSLLVPNLALALKSPVKYGKTFATALKRFARSRKIATFKHFLQAGFLVNNHIRRNKIPAIDHLHGHFAHSPASVTMFASLLSDIPFSFTAHAKDIYTSNKDQLREKIDNAAFVVTCTRYNSEYLQNIARSSSTPVYCVYHGIDTSLFRSSGAKITCSAPYKLLTVARLTEKKGLPTLYTALAILKKRGLLFKHILIGDGDDRDAILNIISELDLTDQCRWLGTQTHEEVLKYFRQSDLFLLSCQIAGNGDRDGIPNVLVESLAMGVPVVSTHVSAIPELIQHENTGLLTPPENSDLYATAIARLLQDSSLRQKVIEEGKQLVQNEFDNTILTRKLAEHFLHHFHVHNSSGHQK